MILVVKGVAKVSKRGSTVVVSTPKSVRNGESSDRKIQPTWESQTIPLLDLELLVIVGSRVRVSSGVLLLLSEAGVPVVVHGRRSNSVLVNPFNVRVADVRRRLYNISENPVWVVSVGMKFIEGKLYGMINLLRYLTYKEVERGKDLKWILDKLNEIEKLMRDEKDSIKSVDALRIYEAKWSKRLWELASTFIPSEYGFTGRDPKSRDPINSAVSYCYAIIYGLCTHALIAAGLDPYVGIIHSERAGKTSLVYDFSEMFKPIAVHAVVVASRATTLGVDGSSYLTKSSLEVVTRHLYRLLKRKHHKWRYTARGEIYAKAWELRQNIEKGTKFEPFIYVIK
jgi:CRISPR-associated protein Cas1